jgi:hypothetical protein
VINVAIYVELKKIADDGRMAKYSSGDPVTPPRTLIIDRDEDRIWPEDGNEDGYFHAAASAVAVAWVRRGELPDRLLRQS